MCCVPVCTCVSVCMRGSMLCKMLTEFPLGRRIKGLPQRPPCAGDRMATDTYGPGGNGCSYRGQRCVE